MARRRILALTLALALLLSSSALANVDLTEERQALSTDSGTVYIGINNQIYTTDSSMPAVAEDTKSLIYTDANVVVFTTQDALGNTTDSSSILVYRFGDQTVRSIADIDFPAPYVGNDALVYFVDASSPNTLKSYSPLTDALTDVLTADAPLFALRDSVDGLIYSTDAGDKLFVAAIGQSVDSPVASLGMAISNYGAFETLLSHDGALSMRIKGAKAGEEIAIDTDVLYATALDGVVYYLKTIDDGMRFASFSQQMGQPRALKNTTTPLIPVLAASAGRVFLLGNDHKVYSYDIAANTVKSFQTLDAGILSPVIIATPEQLLVYDLGTSANGASFKAAYPLTEADLPIEPVSQPTPAPAEVDEVPAPQAPVETDPESSAPVEWSVGSRGDAVVQIQSRLKDHGYLSGKADGIYGKATASAVKYLQYDMGLSQNGKVNESLYKKLQSGDIPDYQRFVTLQRGDNGVRVYDLQVRLSKLGYLTAKPNGSFGPKTEDAVKAFEKADGLKQTGTASVSMQEKLFSKKAPAVPAAPKPTKAPSPTKAPAHHKAKQYLSDDEMIDFLRVLNNGAIGDLGAFDETSATYWVQKRLNTLGYMKKKEITKVFDEATFIALKHFQNDNDILPHPTGLPDEKTLGKLYALTETSLKHMVLGGQ